MKTALVILAAGIGSRFGGGVKQIAPVGPNGEIIIDYSIRDALNAGFDKVVFIIRHDIEDDFKEIIGRKVEKLCEVEYVYQETDDLPYMPKGSKERKKPWGTTHALWCCRNAVNEPFLVINADDYYGKKAYKTAHDFLVSGEMPYGMVGFVLKNTLSEHGGVTRGICQTDDNDMLISVKETYNVVKTKDGAAEMASDGTLSKIDDNSIASMNMWCFTPRIFDEAEAQLVSFLRGLTGEEAKAEHVLPTLVGNMVAAGEKVKVMSSDDTWVGVTYKEDREFVEAYFKKLLENGVYPNSLY